MKITGLLGGFAALVVASTSMGNIAFDDFNRADGPIGPNWNVLTGSFAVSGNMGVSTGAGIQVMDWVGSTNTLPYHQIVASIDVFPHTSLNYVALRTGVGADELHIKLQGQTGTGLFSHVGFYHRTGANSFAAWTGGLGFFALPQEVGASRITTWFSDPDTVHLGIDVGMTGQFDFEFVSGGVLNIAANLGTGLGIGAFGANVSFFDNWQVVPGPGALALLGLAGLVSRRRRRA